MSLYLIEHWADVNASYDNRWTGLMFASRRGFLEIVVCLVEHRADANLEGLDY